MGRAMAHERWLAHAMALAFSSSACGMSEHLPSPPKRQPWYEHISVPSDGSMRPSAQMQRRPVRSRRLFNFANLKLGDYDYCYSTPISGTTQVFFDLRGAATVQQSCAEITAGPGSHPHSFRARFIFQAEFHASLEQEYSWYILGREVSGGSL